MALHKCNAGGRIEMADTKYPQSPERNEYRYIDFEWLDEVASGLTAVKYCAAGSVGE